MNMTQQEMSWFNALVRDREENARILAKVSMKGYRQSPIDEYSDRAHFVYEFLQNADDAKASRCKFSLSRNELLFTHNGSILFKVSNPRTEEQDRRDGQLGGVNAITAAGLSTKNGNEIGRFGIGFKAVFQYTDEPKIYDDKIFFGLKSEIIPYRIGNDFVGRRSGETCFYIPFRSTEKERAYSDIKGKIESIMHPLLFLSNLQEISFSSPDLSGRYSKEVCDRIVYRENGACFDIELEFLVLKVQLGDSKKETKVLKFSVGSNSSRMSVVFGINDKDTIRLEPLQGPAFCFFPTKKDTGLNFLIHAPFLLNKSREGIKEGQPHNGILISTLAALAVSSIHMMVFKLPFESHNWFGKRMKGVNLVDDGILDFVPLDIKDKQDEIALSQFQKAFKIAFTTQALIPCHDDNVRGLCYQKKENVCWSADSGLVDLLTSKQLGALLGVANKYWGFASVNGVIAREKADFIQECCSEVLNWASILPRLTADFFEHQPIDWFERFFNYLTHGCPTHGYPWKLDSYKTLPMFLDGNGKAVPAFDKDGNHILYLPGEGSSTSKTIHPGLLRFASVKRIVEQWNIKKESRLAVVTRIVRDDLVNYVEDVYARRFVDVLMFLGSCSDEELHKVRDAFEKYPALVTYNPVSGEKRKATSSDCYYPTEDLLLYFSGCETVQFVDLTYLKGIVGARNLALFERLISVLDLRRMPKIFTELGYREAESLYGGTRKWHPSYKKPEEKWNDLYLHKSSNFYERYCVETDNNLKVKLSAIYWRFLCQMIGQVVSGHEHIEDKMTGVHHYFFNYHWRTEEYETKLHELLKSNVWLFDNQGRLLPYSELFVETLNEGYDINSWQAKQLFEFLGIRHDEKLRVLNALTDEERQDLMAAKDIRNAGLGSVSEVKSILGSIPEKVRQKICSGRLTAEKILKAVDLLEQTGAIDRNETTGMLTHTQAGNLAASSITSNVPIVSFSDCSYAGLSRDEQIHVNKEAIEIVKNELSREGFDFSNCTEEPCRIDGAFDNAGVERPLVVHSAKKDDSAIFLSSADVVQLRKPNALLIVVTKGNVLVRKTLQDLVGNRERIVLSFSVSNLNAQERINCFADSLRYFKGLRFKFDILSDDHGIAQFIDSPENPISEEQLASLNSCNMESEVF